MIKFKFNTSIAFITLCIIAFYLDLNAQEYRARDLGIPFEGEPGLYNALTDVPGVLVGYKTLISGEGKLTVGKGPVRTGVTVIMPKGKKNEYVPGAIFSLNGDGELTGSHYINDYGIIPSSAIGITNTNSVGIVRDAIGEWQYKNYSTPGKMTDYAFGLPPVGETYDGDFNDIEGLHVKKEHVFEALDSAKSGKISEGNVGGGTGMWLYEFKGGTGTSSRRFNIGDKNYTLGVLVQANFGLRDELTIAGVPVGKEITDLMPIVHEDRGDGSIIVILGTDAPLLPLFLKQVAKRIGLGLARTGAIAHNGSGDIFLAFSTQSPISNDTSGVETWQCLSKSELDPVYKAAIYATEEAVINALVAAKTMSGANGNTVFECPEDRIIEILKKYNRIK